MSARSTMALGERTLIDQLLDEQRQVSAVEEFSRVHDARAAGSSHYRALLPATPPGPGQQYAFEVNLDQCSGCKACVAACHSLNGLDDGEAWRDVGQLLSDDWRRPFQQTVTTACHHCVDPGCLNGCPVLAYDKDPATGIVRHLDDQCIGCQYCVMKCPYEVPKYSERRGIVRKCDLCSQRLAVGEAPACAQACPTEAIRITVIQQEVVRAEFRGMGATRTTSPLTPFNPNPNLNPNLNLPPSAGFGWGLRLRTRLGLRTPVQSPPPTPWLPTAPDPAITLPTTRFISSKQLPADLIPGDAARVPLQPAHWPLVWMLVLTQMSVGGFLVSVFLSGATRTWCLTAALAAGWLGLAASVLHLGRPWKAWRSFLGLRRSWLSREIVVFGVFAPLAAAVAGLSWMGGPESWQRGLLAAAILAGSAGIVCSAMVYHDTQRVFWRGARTLAKFLLTALMLGLALIWAVASALGSSLEWVLPALALAAGLKLTLELRVLRQGESPLADELWPKPADFDAWSLARSARLLGNELGLVTRGRLCCGITGGVFAPLLGLLPGIDTLPLALAALGLCFAGEVAERYTFFRAVVPPRMPGAV